MHSFYSIRGQWGSEKDKEDNVKEIKYILFAMEKKKMW